MTGGRLALALLAAAALAAAAGAAWAVDGGLDRRIGEKLFRRAWVPGVASTKADDGIGPRYNARACLACHQGLGRVDMRAPDTFDRGAVVKLGDVAGGADPRFGRQIQTMTVPGVDPEPAPGLAWRPGPAGPDGTATVAPTVSVPGATAALSLRAAPAFDALAALAAVPDAAILAAADPDDRDGDGIRGRPHRLPDGRIGRFGWKATSASLEDQVARAFSTDMGLSSAAYPDPAGDCAAADTTCRAAPHGAAAGGVEMDAVIVERIALYLAGLPPAAPAPRDPFGEKLFAATGCAACHRPNMGTASPVYSDLLLHDLGPGLDDGVAEIAAASKEWRTAPLAGLGRAERAGLLHDGRARSIAEAIAWHGGEAARARAAFAGLKAAERERLLAFLRGL